MKIASKISISFFTIAVILTGVAALIIYSAAKRNLQNAISAHLSTTARSRANHLETFLKEHKQAAEVIAAGITFEGLLGMSKDSPEYNKKLEGANKRLNNVAETHGEIVDICLLDKNGIVIASTDEACIGLNKSVEEYYLKAQKATYIDDMCIHKPTEAPHIDIAAPVLLNGKALGVIAVHLEVEQLFEIVLDRTGLGETGEIYLVNKDKYMISPSRFEEDVILKQRVDTENVGKCLRHKDKEHVPEVKEIAVFPDYRGVSVLGTHEYIPQMQWCLLAEIDEKEALAPLAKIKHLFVIVILFVPIMAGLVGVLVSRHITRPIDELHKGTEIIGAGNLDYKVGTEAKDEIGQLSRAFDRMTGDLTRTTTSIDKLNKEIAERERAEREVREAMEIKSEFTSMVSHELRTPLTAIKEGIAIVLDGSAGKINDEQKDFLDTAQRNVDRLSRLVNDVLDFQKLEAGRMVFNMEEDDMNKVVKQIQQAMVPLAEGKGLNLITEVDENLPMVRFDEDKIAQVLTNLVNNAVKFTEKGGITVTTNKEDNTIHVAVQDTGGGIKEEDMPRLFRQFEQISQGKGRRTDGTGLGLAISKEIIEKHKGRIWAESKFGEGSTFHFVLPVEG